MCSSDLSSCASVRKKRRSWDFVNVNIHYIITFLLSVLLLLLAVQVLVLDRQLSILKQQVELLAHQYGDTSSSPAGATFFSSSSIADTATAINGSVPTRVKRDLQDNAICSCPTGKIQNYYTKSYYNFFLGRLELKSLDGRCYKSQRARVRSAIKAFHFHFMFYLLQQIGRAHV